MSDKYDTVYVLEAGECPHQSCGAIVNYAAGGEGEPKPGDIMVCFTCGGTQVVNDDGKSLRVPTSKDESEWDEETKESLLEAQEILRKGWTPKQMGPPSES